MPFLLLSPAASFPQRGTLWPCSCYPGSFAHARMFLVTLWAPPCPTPGGVAASPRVFLVLTWLTLTGGL